MPRRSREERELDDRLGEEGDDSNDDDQGVHRCAFCPRVFPTRVPKSIHEGRCNFRFQHFNREPLDVGDSGLDGGEGGEGDEGGDYDNDVGDFELDDDNGGEDPQQGQGGATHENVSLSRTANLLSDTRRAPQEEGLGYDYTATYAPGNLSDLARSIVDKEAARESRDSCPLFLYDTNNSGEIEFGDGGGIDTADLSSHSGSSVDSDFVLQTETEELVDEQQDAVLHLDDPWEDCKLIDDVSHLKVHEIPPKFDPNEMPKLYVAMLALMDILEDCTDLNLFDDIMKWAISFSSRHDGIFRRSRIGSSMATTRKSFMKELRKMFGNKVPPEPNNVHVKLPASNNVTTIPTYPFPECILPLLDDDRLEGDDYLQSAEDNFDRETFWPIVPIKNTARLGELSQLQRTIQTHAGHELEALNGSSADLPSFNGSALVNQRLEKIFRYEDPETKIWKFTWCSCVVKEVLSKPSRSNNYVACLKVKWDPNPSLGWAKAVSRIWSR